LSPFSMELTSGTIENDFAPCSATSRARTSYVYRLEQPDREQVGDHRRAADADERERDAGDRRDPDRHADVDEDLEQERADDPARGDRGERIARARDHLQASPDDEQVEQEQHGDAEEAALL